MALLIYRFKMMVLDQKLNQVAKNQLSTIDAEPQKFTVMTGATTTSQSETQVPSNDIVGILSGNGLDTTSSLSIVNSPEVNEAIQRMRDHGLTSANDISKYQPFSVLTREQAAKMFVQFAKALNFTALS